MPSKNSYVYYDRFLKCIGQKYEDDQLVQAITFVFDNLIRKAPSLSMGGNGWLDTFFCEADKIICSGMWCHDYHCKDHNTHCPYHCRAGNIPSKCKTWKAWRFQWRSFPEKEACQSCRYFKPYDASGYSRAHGKSLEEANKYRCLCRLPPMPEGCPKQEKSLKPESGKVRL